MPFQNGCCFPKFKAFNATTVARAEMTCGGKQKTPIGTKHAQNLTYRNVRPTRTARRPKTAKDFVHLWTCPLIRFGQNGTVTLVVCAPRIRNAWESLSTKTMTGTTSITKVVDALIVFAVTNLTTATALAIAMPNFLDPNSAQVLSHITNYHPRAIFAQDTTG